MRVAILSTFLFLFSSFSSLAQGEFRPGYIVDYQGDSLFGDLAYRSNGANIKGAMFRIKGTKRLYDVNAIERFGYIHGRSYRTLEGFNGFAQVLVSGAISLYKLKDVFILENSIGETKALTQGEGSNRDRWRGVLGSMLSDCLQDWKAQSEGVVYRTQDLTELVVRYNQCKAVEYIEYGAELPWIAWERGVRVGVAVSSINAQTFTSQVRYLPEDGYFSVGPFFGGMVSVSSPRFYEPIFFESGVRFSYHAFEGEVIEDQLVRQIVQSTRFRLPQLTIPAMVGYRTLGEQSKFSVKGGYILFIPITPEYSVTTSIVAGDEILSSSQSAPILLNVLHQGVGAGASYRYDFESISVVVEGEYLRSFKMNQELFISFRQDVFTASVGINF